MSVISKQYGTVLIKRVTAGIECAIGEEQCGFRQGRGCMDQLFAVRIVCEKYLANGKVVFYAFMDLEKAYDMIYRHGVWQMLRVYGVGGKLLKAVQSIYVDSRVCVCVGNFVSEWFLVNVGLRQDCVMSPYGCLMYIYGWCGSRGEC